MQQKRDIIPQTGKQGKKPQLYHLCDLKTKFMMPLCGLCPEQKKSKTTAFPLSGTIGKVAWMRRKILFFLPHSRQLFSEHVNDNPNNKVSLFFVNVILILHNSLSN